MRSAILALLATIGFAATATAGETSLEIPSRTLPDDAFLRGDTTAGTAVILDATLSLPESDGPAALVILLHGTDGPGSGAVWGWAAHLHERGIGTLRLDSYSARNVHGVMQDQDAFGQFVQTYDLYRAVETVAARPDVDPSRIAVMGFSRGGIAALYGAMIRFHETFGPRRGRIVAYLPFYPPCNFELERGDAVVDAPIRLFHGAEDDWTSAQTCRDTIARLAAAGHDATMTEFPGARHAFDNPAGPALNTLPDAETSRNCMRKEVDFRLLSASSGLPFTYDDPCVEHGPTTQFNAAATTAAQEAVDRVLEKAFAGASSARAE